GLGHAARIVPPVEREVLARAAGAITEMGIAPDQPAGEALGIGVEQQLVGVEAVAVLGVVRPVNAIAVELSGRNIVQGAVPDILGAFGQFDAFDFATPLIVEQAKLNFLRVGGEQSKISAPAVPACAKARERSG